MSEEKSFLDQCVDLYYKVYSCIESREIIEEEIGDFLVNNMHLETPEEVIYHISR